MKYWESSPDKMSSEIKKNRFQLEIGHVLFIDIVGYSKLSINDQHATVEEADPDCSRLRAMSTSRSCELFD